MKLSVPKRHIGKKLYTEIWKDIVSYEGLYQISNLGRVRSLERIDSLGRKIKEKIFKPIHNSVGYLYIRLNKNGVKKYWSIHRLVALHFIPNPNNLPEVNHKDEDKTNNTLSNLEWCDRKYNNSYGTRLQRVGEAKKDKKPVYCVELDKTYPNANQCAKELGLDSSNVRAVCKGKRKSTGNYHFYYEENILYIN